MTEEMKAAITELVRDYDRHNFCDHAKEMLETWLSGEFEMTDGMTAKDYAAEFMVWYHNETPTLKVKVTDLEDAWNQSRWEWGEWIEDVEDDVEIYLTVSHGTFQMDWETSDGRKSLNPMSNFNDFYDYFGSECFLF